MFRFILAFVMLLVVGGVCRGASAKTASLVVDAGSGKTLEASNADTPHAPASLTKMMTLYLLFEQVTRGKMKLTTQLPISRYAASMPPTKLGLAAGSRITVRDAILALVTKSANDVAVAVAEAIGGNERAFAGRMNKKAKALGMRRTTFANASGLPAALQKTTARDMATLARALMRNHPRFYPLFSTRVFVHRSGRYRNHNGLLFTYRGVDGVKTGFTQAAGYNLVASAKRGRTRLIGVVLGSTSSAARQQRMTQLLDEGFRRALANRAVAAKSRATKPGGKGTRDVRKAKREVVKAKREVRKAKGRSSGDKAVAARRARLSAATPPRRPRIYTRAPARQEVMRDRRSARPGRGAAAPPG